MRQGQGIGGEGQDGLRKDMPIVALEIQHRERERAVIVEKINSCG
jgi:hypothetical protein